MDGGKNKKKKEKLVVKLKVGFFYFENQLKVGFGFENCNSFLILFF